MDSKIPQRRRERCQHIPSEPWPFAYRGERPDSTGTVDLPQLARRESRAPLAPQQQPSMRSALASTPFAFQRHFDGKTGVSRLQLVSTALVTVTRSDVIEETLENELNWRVGDTATAP